MRIALGLFLISCTTLVQADIYKHVDAQGRITLTDQPRPGATRLLGERTPAGKATKAKVNTPSPAHFPKIDRATQQGRDDLRRQLLLQELSNEQRSLAAVRASLAGQRPGANAERLNETVRLHEKNIEMLNKELAHIR